MLQDLKKIIDTLKDTSNGWVDRRDAADALGDIAGHAMAALRAHASESDVDVRTAVKRALAKVGAVGTVSSATAPPTLAALAQACEKKLKRAVKAKGNGFVVRVQTKDGRTQDVLIAPHKRPDGRELIRVSTQCGEANSETIAWAIRSNAELMYCAFSVVTKGDKELLVIVNNFNPDEVTPTMVKDAVKEIAYYGDWLESKLSGKDDY
tara:strand:- start:952 stop:1575 length:624 start_codon:yes stop_codon:yes gene_type:complete